MDLCWLRSDNPKYTVKDLEDNIGVVGIIKNNDKYLCLWHNKCDCLSLPTGKAEEGQSSLDALKQEMEEELGINVTNTFLTGKVLVETIRNGKKVNVDLHYYIIDDFTGNLVNNEPHKHKYLYWATLEELEEVKYTSMNVYYFLEKILGRNFNTEAEEWCVR